MYIDPIKRPFEVPANEAERLLSVRSLLPSQLATAPELEVLTSLVKDIFHTASCALNIIDEDWQRVAATSGIKAESCPREQSGCTLVVHAGEPVIVEDMSRHPAFYDKAYVTGYPHFRFYAGFPIAIDPGLTLGSLCLIDTATRRLDASEYEEMRRFALLASAMLRLHRSNLYLRNDTLSLRQAYLIDPLTRLYNRRALRDRVAPLLRDLYRKGQSAGIMLLDMDQFKSINDTYGHPAGDQLLKQAADRIRSVIREEDIPLRVGGDEFCIILPQINDDSLINKTADRLIEVFRKPFIISGHEIISPVSIGSLLAPRDGKTPRDLSQRADKALYSAKARGRNCHVHFTGTTI